MRAPSADFRRRYVLIMSALPLAVSALTVLLLAGSTAAGPPPVIEVDLLPSPGVRAG